MNRVTRKNNILFVTDKGILPTCWSPSFRISHRRRWSSKQWCKSCRIIYRIELMETSIRRYIGSGVHYKPCVMSIEIHVKNRVKFEVTEHDIQFAMVTVVWRIILAFFQRKHLNLLFTDRQFVKNRHPWAVMYYYWPCSQFVTSSEKETVLLRWLSTSSINSFFVFIHILYWESNDSTNTIIGVIDIITKSETVNMVETVPPTVFNFTAAGPQRWSWWSRTPQPQPQPSSSLFFRCSLDGFSILLPAKQCFPSSLFSSPGEPCNAERFASPPYCWIIRGGRKSALVGPFGGHKGLVRTHNVQRLTVVQFISLL